MIKNNHTENIDRRAFLKMLGFAGGTIAIAGIANTAFGAGGGAAGVGGGGAGMGGYANGWCSFWHDETDPTYGSHVLDGPNPQGWDTDSATAQLQRLNAMVALDYYGDTSHSLRPLERSEMGIGVHNQLKEVYYEIAEEALQKARTRASEQRGVTVSHARVIGVGIRYMITDWVEGTYGRDGSATAAFGAVEDGWNPPLFYKNEMWPDAMNASSHGIAHGLQNQAGWGDASSIYGYTAPAYATNRDGEWQRAWDDLPGTFTLIVIAIAEAEPISYGKITIKKVLQGPATDHEFTFHILATYNNQTLKDENFTLKHNQTKTYQFPDKSHYEITELPSNGFKLLSLTNASGTIEGGTEVTATATNIQLGYATIEKRLTF